MADEAKELETNEKVETETTENTQEEAVKAEPTQVETTKVDAEEIKTQTKTEVLRDLSKELGVNVFETEGLQKVKELIDSQKTEQEKMQEKLQTYEQERDQWQKEKTNYESKLKASELGIHPNNLEDALKLAEGNPDNLEKVIKKYPIFKSKEGVKIGMQNPNNNQEPTDKSEVEDYMSKNPIYKKYYKK